MFKQLYDRELLDLVALTDAEEWGHDIAVVKWKKVAGTCSTKAVHQQGLSL